jgi:hypothetical protein
MLSVEFYKHFLEYEYILIYQLDALILSDSLEKWLVKDVDYVGPPWIVEEDTLKLESVGNGGFSLRRVKTFINVLESKEFFVEGNVFINLPLRAGLLNLLFLRILLLVEPHFKILNKRVLFLFFFNSNEDLFWSFFAKYFSKKFIIASPEESLTFAFECYPRLCYEKNKQNLPLGVHAWFKHDQSFWLEQFSELEQFIPQKKDKQ